MSGFNIFSTSRSHSFCLHCSRLFPTPRAQPLLSGGSSTGFGSTRLVAPLQAVCAFFRPRLGPVRVREVVGG